MKGLLFTELLEMMEDDFGYTAANAIVLQSNLSSNGIYTASRRYHRTEMSRLFEQWQRYTGLPFAILATAFGQRLGRRISLAYPQHKAYLHRIFLLVSRRSKTPVFEYAQTSKNTLTIVYNPQAKFICLTEGMVKGYLNYLQEEGIAEETALPCGKQKFVLTI